MVYVQNDRHFSDTTTTHYSRPDLFTFIRFYNNIQVCLIIWRNSKYEYLDKSIHICFNYFRVVVELFKYKSSTKIKLCCIVLFKLSVKLQYLFEIQNHSSRSHQGQISPTNTNCKYTQVNFHRKRVNSHLSSF